jgi:thiamine-monophosphate kinase
MPSEFELIERHFKRPTRHTVLGVGDDGAVVRPGAGMELVVSTDMLVAGTHFLADAEPRDLGWKTLAVNVSDMAAMGAAPRWALLAAALPAATESWVAAFAQGFFACADAFEIDVIGGDTTRGPRNFCVTIFGEVPQGRALLRSGAAPGDEIWVSGQPGLAALGLAHLQGRCVLAQPALGQCLAALQRPQPRVALGLALRGLASAAIDVSDGLLADLGHILERSGVAAVVEEASLPGAALAAGADASLGRDCLLGGGDDYELLFTAPPSRRDAIAALAASLQLALTRIGMIEQGPAGSSRLLGADGQEAPAGRRGFDHFA